MFCDIAALRHTLHQNPEFSGQEQTTRAQLVNFLTEHTDLELYELAGGIVAAHREPFGPTLAFRADMDAIPGPGGNPFHGCGHDGHSAILAGLGLMLKGKTLGKSVLLLFQPAEETGTGACIMRDALLAREQVDTIFGFHNIPGYPVGVPLMREGCFACASRGFILSVRGEQSHAAYPELGRNPAPLLGELAAAIPKITNSIAARGLIMATIVGLRAGGKNFGVSAGEGELCLTLRAHRLEDIDALEAAIREFAISRGREFSISFETHDAFPDTQNNPAVLARAREQLRRLGIEPQELNEPMRWSEDFGWFTKAIPGIYFGLGAGECHPGLHTESYEFNDALLKPAVRLLYGLAEGYCADSVFST